MYLLISKEQDLYWKATSQIFSYIHEEVSQICSNSNIKQNAENTNPTKIIRYKEKVVLIVTGFGLLISDLTNSWLGQDFFVDKRKGS